MIIQGASLRLKQDIDAEVEKDIRRFFSSVSKSVYFLIASITGGVDWTDVALPLWEMGDFYGSFYVLFVLGSILGILNIVTGVFVERASNISRIDRDFAVNEQVSVMEQDIHETVLLFHQLDIDGKGYLENEELMQHLTDEHVIAHFATLGIDVTDRTRLCKMFDANQDDRVCMEEFVVGCVRLRGTAKKSDHAAMMIEMHHLTGSVKRLDRDLRRVMCDAVESKWASEATGCDRDNSFMMQESERER